MKSYIDFLTRYLLTGTVSQVICVVLLLAMIGCKSTTSAEEPDQNNPPIEDPVPDTEPPSVFIASPSQDEEIRDEYVIQVSASDNDEVESVSIYLDNELLGTDDSVPYEWQIPTTEFYNGTYTLSAKAIDKAGNETTSDTITFDVLNYLIVLHLKDSWNDYEGIIQANNADESLIGQQEFYGSGTFYLHPPAKESVEDGSSQNFDKIDITIARDYIDTGSSLKFISIQTHLDVPGWSEWTIGEDEFTYNLGNIQLNYADASSFADHEGYIVSSNNENSNSTTNQITDITEIWVWDQPGSQYMATDISNNPRYLMLEELYNGDNITVDLANFKSMSSQIMAIPSSNPTQLVQYVHGRTTGTEGGIWLNYVNSLAAPGSSAEIYYPVDAFPEYEVDIFSTYDADNGIHHYYTREIPDQAKKLTGGITFQHNSPDNLQFSANSTDFDEFFISSFFAPADNDFFNWVIYGPPDRNTLSFPIMTEFFTNTYPSFNRNSFTVNSIELFEYPKLQDGYQEANQLLYENGGQSFYDAITEFIRYSEFVNSSTKIKQLTDLHPEELKNPRFYHPNKFDASRPLVNDR